MTEGVSFYPTSPLNYFESFWSTKQEKLKASEATAGTDSTSAKVDSVQGKIFKTFFKDKIGTIVATQQAARFDTVPFLVGSLATKLRELLLKKAKVLNELAIHLSSGNHYMIESDDLKTIESAIELAHEQLLAYQKSISLSPLATWISVGAPQMLFKNSRSPEEAKQRYVPGLTNLRVQTVADSEGKMISSISRSGSITDFSHGEISLQEMIDYKYLLDLKDNCLDLARKQIMISRYDLAPKDPALGPFEAQKLDILLEEIKKSTLAGYSGKVTTSNDRLDLDPLRKVIREREQLLSLQFLQDLSAHLENKPASGETLIMGRTSLVAMIKPERGKHGVVFSERTMAFDMKAIYDRMDGKTIFFDLDKQAGQTGYIDEKGHVHLPKQLHAETLPPEKGIVLKTVLANLSVQGNIENTGIQKAVNDDALKKLRELSIDSPQALGLVAELENKLQQLEEYASWNLVLKYTNAPDPFAPCLSFHKAIEALNGYGSVNCYGGVDRTGYLVELKTQDALKKELARIRLAQNREDEEKLKEDAVQLKTWGLQQLSDDSIAIQIGYENKGHRAFKLVRFMLDLYAPDSSEGVARRIQHMARSLFSMIPGMDKQKVDTPDKLAYPKIH